MYLSGYIEINLICLILLLIIFFRINNRQTMNSMPQRTMRRLCMASVLLCVSDVVAIISRGAFFPGARLIIEVSNLTYLSVMPVISMLWCEYVFHKVGRTMSRAHVMRLRIPLAIFGVVALTNPLHHFLFVINDQNLYARGPGVMLHWVFSWFYFIYATWISYKAIREAASWSQRNEYKPLLGFVILPAVGCIMQMLFYGVTSVQAGITLSLVLVSLQLQDNQISLDELTGINNRKAMRNYVDNTIHVGSPVPLTVMMIDINHFKRINDTYGHVTGDVALCDTALILRDVCRKCTGEMLFLCRYGGDEFVIVGRRMEEQAVEKVDEMIRQAVAARPQTEEMPFRLEVSIGHASGLCKDYADFSRYLHEADEAMYEDKKRQG